MSSASVAALSPDLRYLLSPQAVRERSRKIFDLTVAGKLQFQYFPEKLSEVADLVLKVTRENYPTLKIPFHSRWGHFQVGGVDRLATLNAAIETFTAMERAKTKLDLAIVSVLLDAGAGMQWQYSENGKVYSRSEGLAVASFHMFMSGAFSSDPAHPLRVDAKGLKNLSVDTLARGFQVSGHNPLVGIEGRLKLLQTLGQTLELDVEHFGAAPARPGNLFDYYLRTAGGAPLPASELLIGVLLGLGPIWPGRIVMEKVSLGDVWSHSKLGPRGSLESLVPFHKLSQWLTYSLIEPLQEYGLEIRDINGLTGLAEYRNGGLLIDSGLIALRDSGLADARHAPDSELVIEWRALTVTLLDEIGAAVRKALGKNEQEMPLARVLEGGTWWAGRRLATKQRSDGGPPLAIISDGTVF